MPRVVMRSPLPMGAVLIAPFQPETTASCQALSRVPAYLA